MHIMDSTWGPTAVGNKLEDCSSSKEREARSVALEKAYVHDVYQQIACHFTDSRYRAWPKVKQFLLELEPGSIVVDVGCANGKYLSFNPSVYKIGLDRCSNLTGVARAKDHEVLICDNLALPFRDECFDAVLSIAVIHHFATTERRVAALKELARVLRIGGRLMVSVWAMEQRHRKFESQDVLVPWNRPLASSSDDKTSSIERDLNSTTTTTSDDDATHYHAYTQTSDSDSFPSLSVGCRKRGRVRHRGRSIDPTCPSSSQSSSDLSSPNESCYSFVRRALQKLAGTKRNRGGRRPWFLQGLDISHQEGNDPLVAMEDDVDFGNINNPVEQFMPIELRQLESTDFAEFMQLQDEAKKDRHRGMLLSNVLYPRRRRTLETTCEIQQTTTSPIAAQPKSKSLSDLFGLLPVGMLRTTRKSTENMKNKTKPPAPLVHKAVVRSQSSLSGTTPPNDSEFLECVQHKAVQTESLESIELNNTAITEVVGNSGSNISVSHFKNDSTVTSIDIDTGAKKLRPTLVKQKHFICSSNSPINTSIDISSENDKDKAEPSHAVAETTVIEHPSVPWGEIKQSVKDLPEFKQPNNFRGQHNSSVRAALSGSCYWKQTSLNEELIFSERLKEKERLKQHLQKQCSLNEELIYNQRENTRWDQMKEAFLNSSNVKCLQLLKHGLSSRFRGSDTTSTTEGNTATGSIPMTTRPTTQTSSLRNGFVRMLQNWKQGEENVASTGSCGGGGNSFSSARRGSKEGTQRRGLFPPFFLRRSSAGSLNLSKLNKDMNDPGNSSQMLSPPPYLKRRPSDNELLYDGMSNGNKLLPGVRHVRKLSREEGSDSSKDSSFQSDTSVDSEDSFASVIFIPKGTSMDTNAVGGGDPLCFNSETRANSTDSDRSPKSPASRLSPPNHNVPKSPSPLASEILRKRSPEVSPSRINLYGTSSLLETTKFVFDESATVAAMKGNGSNTEINKNFKEEMSTGAPLASVAEEELPLGSEEKRVPRKQKTDKIEVLRKPAVLPAEKNSITRQLVRRSLPKALAVDLFNPETDDADTSDTSSSSPNSVSSVVSVLNEDSWNSAGPGSDVTKPGVGKAAVETAQPASSPESSVKKFTPTSSQEQEPPPAVIESKKLPELPEEEGSPLQSETLSESEIKPGERRKLSSASILEAAAHVVSSLENFVSQSSPKARRKFTLARLGSTSEWLSSLPNDLNSQPVAKRKSVEKRNSGEKMLMGEGKKNQPKSHDTKWPASIVDDSSPQTEKLPDEDAQANLVASGITVTADITAKLVEEMEKDSLYDSMENLTNNPSIDSSIRLSSTCSCSIRGGDSFDSWTSAKSSMTNSSSAHHKTSFPSLIPLQMQSNKPTSLSGVNVGRSRGPGSSKSSSAAGDDTEDSTALTYHRYYHVFREGELDKLIEKYVQNLHIISSYYDHANWCIVAEKVQVWTI